MNYIRSLPPAASIASLYTVRQALRILDQYGCQRILDVGCGDAYFEQTFPGRFVGLDIEPQRLVQAGQRGVQRLVVGSGERLPCADCQFDGLLAKDVLEHLYLEQAFRFLYEARRVLRPGGIFITVTSKSVQSFWDKPDHVRPYSNKWVRRVMTHEMPRGSAASGGGFEVIWERELSAGIPGFGRLGLEELTHALAQHLGIRNDHGLIALRKTS
jgi:ubiquinone/menaquinone biosynthesis C-methylase UbiE